MSDTGEGHLYIATQPKLGGCLAKLYGKGKAAETFVSSYEEIELCPLEIKKTKGTTNDDARNSI